MARGGHPHPDSPFVVGKRRLLAKTCTQCGELRNADKFQHQVTGYWGTYCFTCNSKQSNKLVNKSNAESQDKATSKHNPWTDKDIEKLWALYYEGKPHVEIAAALGRTRSSIATALTRFGYGKERRKNHGQG